VAWNEPGGNGRDPWNAGNRRPGDGNMPDVDQVLERLKARFRGKGPGRPGGLSSGGAGATAGALALLWAFSGIYTVDAQETAVVQRFGAVVGEAGPGAHWHLPWPIETIEKINVTGVRTDGHKLEMLTQDENIIDVELKVQWIINSAKQYMISAAAPDVTLNQLTKSAVREVVGRSKMDFILTEGRQEIAEQTQQILQERINFYQIGVDVVQVNLQNIQAPEPVQDAFADAIKAREDQERKKNEAEAYANERVPKAGGSAARERADATAYRDRAVARAQGEADRFTKVLAEYRKAPRVTRDRLYLETMSEVFANATKVVVDTDKNGPMLYLPLDQLRAPRSGDPADSAPAAPARPGSSPGDSRARDRGER
jgi:membrane protease subunit HflK